MRRGPLVAILAGAVVVAAASGLGISVLVAGSAAEPTCESRFGTECSDIPLDQLEKAFDLDLPAGTVVLSSEYTQFQDWRLTATFQLPQPGFAVPEGWENGEPGVSRSAQLDGTVLTLTASTS